jgi:cell wall-associated NlpC family hydrolase
VTLREQIVEEARTWLHTPYHHHARIKGAGVDCVWLLIEVYRQFGLVADDFDPGNYSNEWYMHRDEEIYLGGVQRFAKPLPIEAEPQAGDVALYKVGRCVSHGAILIDRDYVIHANRRAGQVEITELRGQLAPYFHSFWSALL